MSIALNANRSEDTMPRTHVHGVGEVAFDLRDGHAALSHLFQRQPIRILCPAQPADEPPLAAVITTSGGLVGGDRIDVIARVGEGASAVVIAQAAEKIYRSTGADCQIRVDLTAEADSWLEWLPQETILFDQSRLRRRTVLNVAPTATALAGEMLVFGRLASGEVFRHGLLRDAWEIRRDGRLIWADALQLDGNIVGQLDNPAAFDGARAMATAVVVCDDPGRFLELARDITESDDGDLRQAATVVNGVLLLRWMGPDAQAVRHAFGQGWSILRQEIGGYTARLPRLWHI